MRRLLSVITSGLIIGFVTATATISYASLLFSGDLVGYLQQGLTLLLLSSIIISLITACFSSTVEAIGDSQDTVSALLALMLASAASGLIALNRPEQIFPTVIAMMAISSFVLGLFFWVFGMFRWSKLFRYIPFPVIAGVLAGLGWILINASINIMSGQKLSVSNLYDVNFIIHLLPGVLFGIILFYCSNNKFQFLLYPVVNVVMPILFIGTFLLFKIPITEEWFLGKSFQTGSWPPLQISDLKLIHWHSILKEAGNLVALLLTATLSFLFNLTGLELMLKKDIKFDRDLKTMGFANMAVGMVGGVGGYYGLFPSTLNHLLGAKSRFVGVISAFLMIGLLFVGMPILKFIPKSMVGGIILFTGIRFIYDWAFALRRTISFIEYVLILSIFLITAFFGFLQGTLCGIAIAIIIFVVEYGRIDVLKASFTGNHYQSHIERSFQEEKYLEEHGTEIYILRLHSFLFFGTAHHLYENIIRYIESHSIRYIVIDFKSVYGIDSSSILAFLKLGYYLKDKNIYPVFTGLAPRLKKPFLNANETGMSFTFFDTLDYGVEWCENDLLKNFTPEWEQAQKMSLPDILPGLSKQKFLKGEYLIHQGSSSSEMFIVQSGIVTVIANLKSGEKMRIRTFLPGTLIGEPSFFLNAPRTADVVAECDTIVYKITKSDLDRISKNSPILFAEFQNYIIKVLSERLSKFYYIVE